MLRQLRTNRRHGLTLIELLVVITIIVLLTALAIPLLRPALQDRKLREASRQVNTFIVGAQARAAERGRPVGVWIEREGTDPTTVQAHRSYQLYMAEVPPPYSGDIEGATCLLLDSNLPGTALGEWGRAGIDDNGANGIDDPCEAGWPPYPATMLPLPDDGDGVADAAVFDVSSASLPMLVSAGDFIRFDHQGPVYEITSVSRCPPIPFPPYTTTATRFGTIKVTFRPIGGVWLPGADGVWGAPGDDDGDGLTNELDEAGFFNTTTMTWTDDVWVSPPGPQPINGEVTYQILRKPQRGMSRPVELPSGVVLDLSVSGIGSGGSQFDPDAAVVPAQPVIITFTPNGQIDFVYYNGTANRPLGPIHLLVGRNEQVDPVNFRLNVSEDERANLVDTTTTWITIDPRLGAVRTSPNANIQALPSSATKAAVIAAAREFARTGATSGGL